MQKTESQKQHTFDFIIYFPYNREYIKAGTYDVYKERNF